MYYSAWERIRIVEGHISRIEKTRYPDDFSNEVLKPLMIDCLQKHREQIIAGADEITRRQKWCTTQISAGLITLKP